MVSERIIDEDLNFVLEATAGLWDEIRNKRIFITGGTGFFGCWLLESFTRANDRFRLNASATVLSRNPAAFKKKAPHLASHPAVEFHTGDVRNFKFPDGIFTHVIHAATGTDIGSAAQDPLSMFESMVQGTRHVLDFAKHCSAGTFLFISSGAVYGKQPPDISHISEDYAGAPGTTNPASAYGEAKRVSEFLCAMFADRIGFEAKIARCFAFVGPHLPLDADFAIGNFIGDALKNEPIRIKGDGTPFRSYLYASDLMIWLWTIFFKGKSNHPYNVGSDRELNIADIAKVVARLLLNNINKVYTSQETLPGRPAERYVPSVFRANSELGLIQKIDLEEAIRRTASWYSGQQK